MHNRASIKTVVIIGGGLGGLFTGALLAKKGIKVTLIEKNSSLGGGLQTFVRFGEVYDTGMHVVAGMHEGGNIRRLCDYLGVYDESMFVDVNRRCSDSIYIASGGMTYRIAVGKEGYLSSICRYFPEQRENIKRYIDALYAIVDEMPLYHLRSGSDGEYVHNEDFFMAADDFISKYITDERLKGIVSYLSLLYCGEGHTTPAYIHAVISVLYFTGPSRFAGGSHRFAELLEKVILDHGGEIILNDAVKHIHNEGRKIQSVETSRGKCLHADCYISDIHPSPLIELFDEPSAFPKAYRNRIAEVPNTYSAFTINLKFHANTFMYLNHTGYYFEDYDSVWKMGDVTSRWPLGFLYMTPPEVNQGKYSTKMIITVPMPWEYVKKWEETSLSQRSKDYQFWKKQCMDIVLDKLEEIYPGLRNCIEAVNTASPLTIRDYYGTKEGAMCGIKKDCKNINLSQMSVRTKVENLLLTGQNVSLHGFCGVPLTAVRTCEEILGRNTILDEL